MRICLLGDFTGSPDEGMKNVSRNLRDRLSPSHEILALNSRDILTKVFLNAIRSFQPKIIHYLHGPTIRSLIILKIAKLLTGNKGKTVCSATKPYFSLVSRPFIPWLRPDLVLTQSLIWENFFKSFDFQVKFFPNGINTSKFRPATKDEKIMIREKWRIPSDKFVVLHVGHIRRNRNLEIFMRIQEMSGLQVVIAGGTANPVNEPLKGDLISSGCRVYHRYIDNIYDLYKMADLYIFPTRYNRNRLPDSYNQIGAIDIPLSVLEAMACNLPVMTTRFGALERIFEEKEGFYFSSNENELVKKCKDFLLSREKIDVNTRKQVLFLSWGNLIHTLESYYEQILKN